MAFGVALSYNVANFGTETSKALPTFLLIETSATVCSVCVSRDGEVVALKENTEGNQHANLLTVFIKEVLAEAGMGYKQLDAVVLSTGPGSYTGLRIGASAAKAICYTGNIPLIGISTLQAMVAGYITQHGTQENTLYCPMVDARRMEVYAGIYNHKLENLLAPRPWILTEENLLQPYTDTQQIVCFGSGAPKAEPLFAEKTVTVSGDFLARAEYMIQLATICFNLKQFQDIAYFEPAYLKSSVLK